MLFPINILAHARIIPLLKRETKGMSYLQKPEKIYLQNTDLAWLLSENKPNTGNFSHPINSQQADLQYPNSAAVLQDYSSDDFWKKEQNRQIYNILSNSFDIFC